ncbi:M20/M25/M40 family metallo-hydrolase [Glacieibacterium frigidum]|uniref:Carboxypeptidase Q n=1 Tax=Glacieibacterium frigidum TaxID=2593303 RepID=A0A552UIG4_9SPHN|nr:M20/M25/M40 family metallo-hydrolase [Glacieibacterium frigidum]TRW17987.1 M20/M25/M40 family metallo-hydrolase [Glacieibacterium frigidum]
MIRHTCLLALVLAGPAVAADPDTVAASLRDRAMAGSGAYALVESLTTEIGPRLAGTPDEARARIWAVAKLKALGFKNVRVEPFDMPVWVRGIETAAVLGANAQPLAVTALGRSGATPANGLEADVVRFATYADLEAAPAGSLAGKIAFIDHKMLRTMDGSSYGAFGAARRSGPSLAASKGAAAVLIRSLGTGYHRHPHTGGTNWAAGQTPIAAAALSLNDSDQLNRLLAKGPVRLRLVLTPRLAGTAQSGNVVGEVVGTDPGAGAVVIGGHLDSWDHGTGAVDDGAGVAITVAAAKLIMDHAPKPRRTVRVVLWGAEEPGLYGAAAYAAANPPGSIALAAESDFGGGRVTTLKSRVAPEALPLVKRMQALLAPLGITPSSDNSASGGPDVGPLAAKGVGTLTLQQDGTDYFDLHHTPDDTLDKIDAKLLDQNVAAYAVTTWIAATSNVSFARAAAATQP